MQLHASTSKSALWVLAGLALLVVVGVAIFWKNPDFPILSFVGGISTLAVALLTVAYVITTSGQLAVMNAQLEQMQRSRDFQAQPLPVTKLTKVEIENPRVFYSPPEDEYSALGRVYAHFQVQNEGTHPAINVVLSGRLLIPLDKGSQSFESASILAEVVPESGVFPSSGNVDFMFTSDRKAEFIEALRRRDPKRQPVLSVMTIFRNALGSCFAATSYFQLSIPDSRTETRLTTWHSALVAFPVQFKAEIERLRKIRDKKEEDWSKLFSDVKKNFEKQLQDKNNVELKFFSIPLSFKVEALSEDAFEKEIKKRYFGSPIPHWVDECLHAEK